MQQPYISRIEISNFRNFRHIAVDLSPTCVLIGENKAGKSNFVEAIRLILDPTFPDSARNLRDEDFWDGLESPFQGNIVEVKVFIRGFDKNIGAKAVLADCIVDTNPYTALLSYRYAPSSRKGIEDKPKDELGEDDYEFVIFGGKDPKHRVGSEIRRWLALVLLPALRDAETDIQLWRKSPLRPLLERIKKDFPAEALTSVRDELDNAKSKLLEIEPIEKLIKEINARVEALIGPIHAVQTDLDFAASDPEQLIKSLRLFLVETRTKPLSDASLGTANILFLALLLKDMEFRQAEREIVSTVLAIEEPEAHLHPHLQRLLFRHFLSREHSIIVTTHSPNIASVSPLESIVLLRNNKKETTAFTVKALGLQPQENEDLQRYLDVTRAEMLFAKAIIFVEGSAEEFLIPAFAKDYLKAQGYGGSLEEFGVSVCSVNGTDFAPFFKMVSEAGLNIPCAVITDGDLRNGDTSEQHFLGLRRGAALLEESEKEQIANLLDEKDFAEASKILAARGIFVGIKTLEIDMVADHGDEMIEAYGEVRNSEKASGNFEAAVRAVIAERNVDAEKEIVRRIEYVGKGRFAQRLASKIEGSSGPTYIRSAIAYVINAVKNG